MVQIQRECISISMFTKHCPKETLFKADIILRLELWPEWIIHPNCLVPAVVSNSETTKQSSDEVSRDLGVEKGQHKVGNTDALGPWKLRTLLTFPYVIWFFVVCIILNQFFKV